MSYAKCRFVVLGFAAVATLVMVAFVSSAQASQFVFKNKAGVEVSVLKAQVIGQQEGSGGLSIPSLNLAINCAKFTVKSGVILSSTTGHAQILFEECTALERSAPFAELPCHVTDVAAGKPELLHITSSAKLSPISLGGGAPGILVEEVVSTLNFLPGTGCPLPLKNIVKGTMCAEIKENEKVKPLALFSEAIQKACADKMFYGANEMFVSRSATLQLVGEHEGFTLGVL